MTKTVEAARVIGVLKENKELLAKFTPARTFDQQRPMPQGAKPTHSLKSQIEAKAEEENTKRYYRGMNNSLHSPSMKRLIMTDTDGNYILR